MAALTEEQSMIRDQAKSWVSEQAPVNSFRKMRDDRVPHAFVPSTWTAMVDMGWTGIVVPEQYGGSDLGYLTFGVVLEEIGRQLTASPLFTSSLVGASALVIGGSEVQKQQYLPKIVDGSSIFTFAIDEGPRHNPRELKSTVTKDGSGYLLSGDKTFVLEGMTATQFIVVAKCDGDVRMFIVEADADGVSREPLATVDSRGYANVHFSSVRLTEENVIGGADEMQAVLDRARAGLAAEMLGTGCQAFDMTLEYLKTRVQFGQVIGSFQALGHRAAELFSQMELSRSCIEGALQAIDAGTNDIEEMSALSKARAGDFLFNMSNQLIQIHGGIGMTDEFDAGLYLKRARTLETAFGNRAFHKDRYARLMGF